jgi:glycopeptide antibiotics resistance protein
MGNMEFFLNTLGIFIFFSIFSIVKNSFYDNIYGKKIPSQTDGYPIILFIISGILLAGTILRGIIS